MIKKYKRIKKNFIKKKKLILKTEKIIILKSFYTNLKLKNNQRFILKINLKAKKKIKIFE